MFHRTTLISLATTSIVAGVGVGATFLLGGFNKSPKSQIKRVVGRNNKPTTMPNLDVNGSITDSSRSKGEEKENVFKQIAGGVHERHPGAEELLRLFSASGNKRSVPALIAEGCKNNSNDETIDVSSNKAKMLEKLCDATFEQN